MHSIRIYELITQYRSVGNREITVDKLKEWLQVADNYPRWNNFKARVLDPAITEINEKSDLFVEVEQIKRGRSIHSLHSQLEQSKRFKLLKNLQNALIFRIKINTGNTLH